jgi:hypothetical protein
MVYRGDDELANIALPPFFVHNQRIDKGKNHHPKLKRTQLLLAVFAFVVLDTKS